MKIQSCLRYFGTIILFFFVLLAAHASRPWVEPGMHYFKMKIGQDGIYRIGQSQINQALSDAGFSASSVDPAKWALFFRGKEMAIDYDNGDILFYGQKNDATLDTGLYFDGGLVNTLINTHSDTTAYFLSWYPDSRVGKRIQSLLVTSPTTLPFHYEKKIWSPASYNYHVGENYYNDNSANVLYGSFQIGEGWVGLQSASSVSMLFDSLESYYAPGPQPYLELHFSMEDKSGNSANVVLGSSSTRSWRSGVGANGVGPLSVSGVINHSDIQNNALNVELSVNSGLFSSVYGFLYYPQATGMFGAASRNFLLDSGGSSEKAIEIMDLGISSASQVLAWDITDPYNIRACSKSFDAGSNTLRISVNGADTVQRKILLERLAQTKSAPQAYFRDFQDLSNPDQDFIIVYPSVFDSAASAYASYRSSLQGGAYHPLKIDIEEVFDQFSFGEFSPVGIHELCRYMHNHSTAPSNYLFLMGKGIHFNAPRRISGVLYRWRFNQEVFSYDNLIPTFGYPGGDWPFTMNLDPAKPKHPAFGVGRITSRDQQQVFDYLEKVKAFEDPANNGLWRKRLLHLSGGISEQEIQRFYAYVNQFKDIAEGEYLGGNVQTISKTDPAALQTILVDTVINDGISVLTMYGHSSVDFNDIEIGDVNDPNLNYNNTDGKFPMFIINGCESGRIYEEFESWAQNWVNEAGKGASILLAHSFEGFDPILKYYTEEIYRTAFADSSYFGQPIGDIMTEVNKRFHNKYDVFWGPFIQSQIELMTFQGDPALRISPGLGLPDYALDASEIAALDFGNSLITTNTDSFQLKIPLANFGRKTDQRVSILVERLSPEPLVFDTLWIDPFGYSDTVYYTVYNSPNPDGLGGLNSFSIRIDPPGFINESDKDNNIGIFELLIPNQAVRNIRPSNFGIVTNRDTRLVSSGILAEGETSINYVFELDTAYAFNSPYKQAFQSPGGVVAFWDVSLLNPQQVGDTTVYYWRSKKLEDTVWSESSFTYIPAGSPGWSQSEYGQYIKNEISGGLEIRDSVAEFAFSDFITDVDITYAGRFGNYLDTSSIKIGNALLKQPGPLEARRCGANRLLFVRISAQTGQAYRDLTYGDNRNCGIQPFGVRQLLQNDYLDDTISTSFLNYLDATKDEDYILLMAHGRVLYDMFSKRLKDSLALFGIDTAVWNTMDRFEPFLFLGKKGEEGIFLRGDTGLAVDPDSQILEFNYMLTEFNRSGRMLSGRIGPAQNWGSATVEVKGQSTDSSRVSIYGIRQNGEEKLVRASLGQGNTTINDIDASEYPWIRMEAYFEDTVNRSSPQLEKWQIFYQGAAEGVLDPLAFGEQAYLGISVQEGDTVRIPFCFKNISEFDFSDSLKIVFTVNESLGSEARIAPIASADSSVFEYELITTPGMEGKYRLRVFVNPFEIPELYYDNNILEVPFEIYADNIPPTLSATIDGNRVVSGDVVRYNPGIRMVLNDENPFLNVTDSTSIFFTLYKKENLLDSIIRLPNSAITWWPESDSNDFTLFVEPDSLGDGLYLLEFNGRDASGNLAGPFPKSLEFEVQTAQPATAEDLKIFPNPFQSALEMQLFIKAKAIPEKAEIRIFDLQGKLVFQSDLRNRLKLGSNRIRIWDGRNFENQLVPSGIYIYHMDIRGGGIENSIGSPIIEKVLFQP